MTGFEEVLQQHGPVMTMVLAFVLTVLWALRATSTAHLRTASADGETQSVVARLALAGDQRATELVATSREVTELRVQIARMQGDIKVLKEKEARIPALEEQIELLTQQIAEIQATYTTQIEVLEQDRNRERQQNTFLLDENTRLKETVIPGLENQIEVLRARVTELEAELQKLKNGNGVEKHE